jgi:hypothetical protein
MHPTPSEAHFISDARLWHPWLRINRILRVMLHMHWSVEAWPQIPGVETRARSRKPRSERRTPFRAPCGGPVEAAALARRAFATA